MPVPKAIMQLAVPTVLSMMVQILYNLTDTFFIGKLNDPYQVAAVTIALPLFMIQMAIAGVFGNGGASYLSRLLGARQIYEARETTTTAIFTSALVSIAVGILGFIFVPHILYAVGATANTYSYAAAYMKIILLGSPIVMLNFTLSQLIRAEGGAKTALIGMVIGTGLNIVLDPIFILWFKMGVSGAAVATLVGNFFAVVYYFRYYLGKHSMVAPAWKFLHLRKIIFAEIFKIGVPSSLSQFMMSIGSSLSYRLAVQYSDNHVAALGVAMRVFSIPIFVFIGIAIGIQPLIGYSYGAQLYGRMRQTIRTSITISLALAIGFLLLFALLPTQLVKAFIPHPEVVSLGSLVLQAYVFAIPFAAIGMILMVALQAMGKAMPALIVALSRQGIVYIPAIILLNRFWAFDGLIFALPFADACTVLISFGFLYHELRKTPHTDIGLGTIHENA